MDLKNIRILLVDDEEAFRKGLAKALARRNIGAKQSESGEECLSLLEREPMDIVILDVKMPRMNGLEALGHIKKKYPKTEVILLTGHATTDDGVEGIKLGAFDYLSKPVQLEHLLGKIGQAYQKILQEEKIRNEAETRYQALLQSVTDYVVGINRNFQIIMANDLFRNNFGTPSEGLCYQLWKNRDAKCENCLVEKSLQDGQVHVSNENVVMADGSTAQLRIRSTPVKNERGKIIYVLETATDIIKMQYLRNELNGDTGNLNETLVGRLRDLQESEKRYRTIFERSRDFIMLIDLNGKILEINQAGIEILGYRTREDLLDLKSAEALFADRESLYHIQNKISQQGYITEFETKLVGHQGREFDALITANVIMDELGKITGHFAIIRDVTKRRMAQRQIEKRNIRLAILRAVSMAVSNSLNLNELLYSSIDTVLEIPEIVEPDSVGIYLLDDEEKGLELVAHKGLSTGFVSKDYVKYRPVGEGHVGQAVVTGKTIVVDNFLHEEDPAVDTIVEEGLRATVYIPLVAKGKPVGVMCVSSHSPFKFSSYHVEFLTAIGHQLGVAVENANLFEKSKKSYEELKDIQEQIIRTEKLASLGKLSATIAHEINNPLAAVLTYVRLMLKLMSRDLFTQERAEDIKRYLDTMESETARCGEIVKNLLAFSRHSKIIIQPHRIEEILDRTLVLIAHDLEINDIRLVKKIDPGLPKIKCDFKQIQQAILNLLSNASESMSKGGVLSVSARAPEDDGFVEVEISDTGCGILEEDLKDIFEPFFTTKEEGKGVGLGLSVVFGIITRHNGFIEVESGPEKGTSFKVKLPAA
jgi:PAS domain S-box-containing protein